MSRLVIAPSALALIGLMLVSCGDTGEPAQSTTTTVVSLEAGPDLVVAVYEGQAGYAAARQEKPGGLRKVF